MMYMCFLIDCNSEENRTNDNHACTMNNIPSKRLLRSPIGTMFKHLKNILKHTIFINVLKLRMCEMWIVLLHRARPCEEEHVGRRTPALHTVVAQPWKH